MLVKFLELISISTPCLFASNLNLLMLAVPLVNVRPVIPVNVELVDRPVEEEDRFVVELSACISKESCEVVDEGELPVFLHPVIDRTANAIAAIVPVVNFFMLD